MIIRLFLGLLGLLPLSVLGMRSEGDLPHFFQAEQDETGGIWACDHQDQSIYYSTDGKNWKAISPPFKDENPAGLELLFPLSKGAVGGLWRLRAYP